MKAVRASNVWDVQLDENDRIVPCPFCGCASVEMEHTWTASYWVSCTDCGAQVHGDYGGDLLLSCADPDHSDEAHLASAQDALNRWNKRISLSEVKALEWRELPVGNWEVATLEIGDYLASDTKWYNLRGQSRDVDSRAAAKAAAQADYERLTLSAIEPAPVLPLPSPVVEAICIGIGWTREDLANGLAELDGIDLRCPLNTVLEREYLNRADDLLTYLSVASAANEPLGGE